MKGFAAEILRLCVKVKTLDFVNTGELMSKVTGPREVPVPHSRGQAYPVAVTWSEAAECQLCVCVCEMDRLCGGGRC